MQIFAMQIMFKICVSYHNDHVSIETTEDHSIVFKSVNNGLTRLNSNTYKLDLCIKRHKGSMKISSISDKRTLLLIPFRSDESLHLRAKCNVELKVKKDGEIVINGDYGKPFDEYPSDEFASDFSFSDSSSDSSSDDEHSNSHTRFHTLHPRSEEEEEDEEEDESNDDQYDSYGNPYDQYSDLSFDEEEEEEEDPYDFIRRTI